MQRITPYRWLRGVGLNSIQAYVGARIYAESGCPKGALEILAEELRGQTYAMLRPWLQRQAAWDEAITVELQL